MTTCITHGSDGQGELRHGVEGVGATVNQLLNKLGKGGPGSPLGRERLDLLLGRDLTGDQKPEESLGEGLSTAGGSRELLLALRDGESSESDTLIGIEDGSLPNETLDSSHTTVGLVDGDLTERLGSMGSTGGLDVLDLLGDDLSETLLQGLSTSSRGVGPPGSNRGLYKIHNRMSINQLFSLFITFFETPRHSSRAPLERSRHLPEFGECFGRRT